MVITTIRSEDDAELPIEIGISPLADRLGDFLHLLGAVGGVFNLPDEHQGIGQAGQRDGYVGTRAISHRC